MVYPGALSTKVWVFYDVFFKGKPFKIARKYGSYVMEHVLFKISYPAEFHAQTAVEAALELYPLVRGRLDEIDKVVITTHQGALRIIDKRGPLRNPADRDHCLQYMVAVALIFGELTAQHYEEETARDRRIDRLRSRMRCVESRQWSRDYLDPAKRSIANAVQVFFRDGTSTRRAIAEYPLGHRRRRAEGIPLLIEKFKTNLARRFPAKQSQAIVALCMDPARLHATPVSEFSDLFVI